jgi:restriction endonuclease Mrr
MSRPRYSHEAMPERVREQLRQQLLEQLLTLPVPAFGHLIAHLLRACGYEEVQVLAGMSGGTQAGADLSASTSSGLSRSVTLVQAKQYRAPVSRRFVDELRGAMLRTGASQGLLLTTSTFYLPARRAVWKPCPLPVRLVDGRDLLDLLLKHGLGVTASATGRIKLDRRYFGRLRREHGEGSRPQQRPHVTAEAAPKEASPKDDALKPVLKATVRSSSVRSSSCGARCRSWLDIFRGA